VPEDDFASVVNDEDSVTDEAVEVEEQSLDILPRFEITAYGADYPVDALVKRFDANDIEVPQWQRGWVWSKRDAARFIESLLLGLPVPGIFLYLEPDTRKLLVVDGQQRLRSLVAYYNNDLDGGPFRLPQRQLSRYQPVNQDFAGRAYRELEDADRRTLDNQIIHATVVKQDAPEGDLSIYHLFERINSTGVRLQPQEIRSVVYRGRLDDLLQELNTDTQWREIYGQPSRHLKDQELILRFLALFFDLDAYERPMTDFLNFFMQLNRNADLEVIGRFRNSFVRTIHANYEALGRTAFRPERTLNAAVFDAAMVGLARRLSVEPPPDKARVRAAYEGLLGNEAFRDAYLKATSDAGSVRERVGLATAAFKPI